MSIDVKRAYETPATSDGCRILVDRIWPRGITKDDLQVDAWLKDLAPSTGLRKWFGHDPKKWDEFRKRYAKELEQRSGALAELIARAESRPRHPGLRRQGQRAQQRGRAQAAAGAPAGAMSWMRRSADGKG